MTIEIVWRNIRAHAGEAFQQLRGATFRYRIVSDNVIRLDRTNQQLSRAVFEKALRRMPVDGPAALNDLRAPSYVFAILTDPRISS